MNEKQPKPYWHVDLKWVCGLLLVSALFITLLFSLLTRLTARENAVSLASYTLAVMFSREEGIDGTESVEKFKSELDDSAEQISPLPGMPGIVISRTDLDTLSPRELRLKIFNQVVEPLYDLGVEGAALQLTSDPAAAQKLSKDASLLKFLTKPYHQRFQTYLIVSLTISILLMAGFVYFSFGWGRLGNPGLLLVASGLPGLLAGLLLANPPQDGNGGLGYLPTDVAERIGGFLASTYGVAVVVGLVLLVSALFGSLYSKRQHRQTAS